MGKKGTFFLVGAWISASAIAPAEGRDVHVSLARASVVVEKPRQVMTAAVRVTNRENETRWLSGQVQLPAGWHLVTTESPFQLDPGGSDIRLVSFLVPPTAPPRDYEISYSVTDSATGSILDSCDLRVAVLPFGKLEASSLHVPQCVIAGEEYRVSFAIANHGNTMSSAAVEVESSDGYVAEVTPKKLELGPGKSKEITVTVRTDPEIRQELKHRLELRVRALGPDDQGVIATAKSSVKIIPQIAGVDDPFHRSPVKVVLRSIMESGATREHGFQADFMGSGTLDEEGKKRFDFLFRGPDVDERSVFAERDEYRISYQTDRYQVRLGDQIYALSPLTEWYRYGFGADLRLNVGKFGLGGYHQKSRWFEPEEEQSAATVEYRITDNYRIGVNYLKKKAPAPC